MPRRHPARAAAVLLAVVATAGCQFSGLQFQVDHRLHFDSPRARHRVTAPVTVRWTMKDFTTTGLDGSTDPHQGVFAVFVDEAPMPVGKDLKWIFRDDSGCKHDSKCPTTQQLNDHDIFLTTDTQVTIQVLPQAPDGVGDEQHYVNVVLLDGTGHRIGESAWYLPFTSKRRSL